MKIIYKKDSLSAATLAAGLASRELPFNLVINGDPIAQTVHYLRAGYAQIFHRANFQASVSFSVIYKKASITAALQHLVWFTRIIREPGVQDERRLLIYATDNDGSPWQLLQAVGRTSGRLKGLSVQIDYSFTGSEWTQ